MKTTIDLPGDLLYHAKVVAAERRTTLRKLVVKGLEAEIAAGNNKAGEPTRKETFSRLLRSMRAANIEAMQPLAREELHDR